MIEWQNDPPKKSMNWHKAIEYAESLGDGWRLPTRAELIDAYDNNVEGFKDNYYWSSSTYAQDTNRAWRFDSDNGNVGYIDKTSNYYVCCVREIKGKKKMNKDEIQNKIKQLEKELNELKNKMINSTWEPYEKGYYIDTNGYCYEEEGLSHKYPAPHNCFRTRELAELRAHQREAEDELFNIWEHLVGDWRPNNKDQSWHIVWNEYENVPISFTDSQRGEISLYKLFPSQELAHRQYELASDHARAYIRGEF